MARLYTHPQPYRELDHTADVGLEVRGADAQETLARLVLGFAALLSGGGEVRPVRELRLSVEPAAWVDMAIDVLRELLFRFDCEHVIPASVRIERFEPERGASLVVELGRWDADLHAEGTELKAVTLHAARFEREGDGVVASVVFDI